ncbi:MAG: YciK family oxidoreductase [Steroidobacteraceae bacterium]|nr:YciK family oxidoreductase [Nevskiaceae bacterium]MCP5359931.1 YciK family oxidoreductase [Nevskiaceae bacterium]MCP5467504.1 YciK family oxidoreductase [Nevskiaceae bacterium]
MTPDDMRADFDPRRLTPDPDALAGRVLAITGPTAGLGRALALEFARRGAELILLGRSVRKLEALDAEIMALTRHDGRPVVPPVLAPLDLEKALAGDYDAIATAVEQRWGRLDGLVHNAGLLGTLAPIEQYDVPTWMRVMHVNLNAPFALTQVLTPALRASADASVLFISSSVGRRGRAYWGAYAVSKFAIEGLVQVLSAELERSPVRVNAINPGRMRTAMRRQAFPAEDLATLPEPAALTAPYVVLMGSQSRGITGGSFDAQ